MISSPRAICSPLASVVRKSVHQPSIAASGVRSSCESVARKSSLSRFARSASPRAMRSLSSSASRSDSARSRRATSRPNRNIAASMQVEPQIAIKGLKKAGGSTRKSITTRQTNIEAIAANRHDQAPTAPRRRVAKTSP
jgi:hypothetical protein